jgi:hypothetical protein
MTQKAREVLSDCRVALALLEDDTENARWRVHWAAAVALIRAVGHVLRNVDGQNAAVRSAADAAFSRWNSDDGDHEIFRQFIERERNNLLKEYRTDVHPLTEVSLAIELTLQPVAGGETMKVQDLANIDENIYRPMVDGPWEGDDARDVLTTAIEWWERELLAIDVETARLTSLS